VEEELIPERQPADEMLVPSLPEGYVTEPEELLVTDVEAKPAAGTVAATAGRREPARPGSAARPSSGATRGSARGGSAAASQLPPMNQAAGSGDETLGDEANARYQKAQLAVTLEELERLRSLLVAKSATVAEAEASVRELQQRVSKLERSERAMQVALEKERIAGGEARRRSEALEQELGLLRKESSDTARRDKSTGAEQRSKDVRLNRALEELERTRGQLRQLREEREAAGSGARGEAARLAAENTRLRKRQSELLLAFKKQAKLIDVLKRQKLHVEAATLLSFTEAEFSRTLELGEALA